MAIVTENSVNPLSTVSAGGVGLRGAGQGNTWQYTIPATGVATITLPAVEAETFPCVFSVCFENVTGTSAGGSGIVTFYSNAAAASFTSMGGNLVSSGTPSVTQLNAAKSGSSLVLSTNAGGLTNGAKIRVTRIG